MSAELSKYAHASVVVLSGVAAATSGGILLLRGAGCVVQLLCSKGTRLLRKKGRVWVVNGSDLKLTMC